MQSSRRGTYVSTHVGKVLLGELWHDVQNWVKNCQHCKAANGPYTDPEPPQGSTLVNNPMDVLCLDFIKVEASKSGKRNILVMMDAFSKFSIAVVTPNQKAKIVAYALVNKWFYTYGISAWIHSDPGKKALTTI